MRRKLLPLILGGALSIAAVAPASAATCTNLPQQGGAAGLVALVLQAQVQACEIDIDLLNNSLNNLLRNADIDVLNNILNNSPFLNDVEVTVIGDDLVVNVLSAPILVLSP